MNNVNIANNDVNIANNNVNITNNNVNIANNNVNIANNVSIANSVYCVFWYIVRYFEILVL